MSITIMSAECRVNMLILTEDAIFANHFKTTSIDVARARRDALVEADDLFWAGVSSAADGVSTCA